MGQLKIRFSEQIDTPDQLGSVRGLDVRGLDQFRVPAHLRSASAMALRAGAPSQRLHFPHYVQF